MSAQAENPEKFIDKAFSIMVGSFMARFFPAFLAAVAVGVFAGCGAGPASGKLRVVATTSIVADWVRQIGGEEVEVVELAGPGTDPHAYQATPADAAAVETAALVVSVGAGYETWLPGLLEATHTKAAVLALAKGMPLLELEEEETGHEGHEHGEEDPHFWHDPELAMQAVSEIANAFKKRLPEKSAVWDERSKAYQEILRQTSLEIRGMTSRVLQERRKLVTSHDSFAYFARRYGFSVLGSALGTLSTEASRPSAADLAALVATIKAAGVPAIFPESTLNSSLVQQVAREAGVQVAPPLQADALNSSGEPGSTYVDMMKHNAEIICQALGEGK